jgi:hypothetical protein
MVRFDRRLAIASGMAKSERAKPANMAGTKSRMIGEPSAAMIMPAPVVTLAYGLAPCWQSGGERLSAASMTTPLIAPVTAPRQRKPDWIRVKAPTSEGYAETKQLMRSLNLATVCEEAACPNIGECWSKKHATVMILGDTCTRACAFCNVKTGMPRAVDLLEPQHTADAAAALGLKHIVVTSVDRDDLPDGGASQFVKVIEA